MVAPIHIFTISLECLGVELGGLTTVFTSGSEQAANDTFYIPFRVSQVILVDRMFHNNGATAAGAVELGIYTQAGVRVAYSGSISQTGTSVLQQFTAATATLAPGRYYMAANYSDAGATAVRAVPGIQHLRAMGVLYQSVAGLPETATFAPTALNFLPMMGLSLKSTI
jgi:hypothetical protein